MRSGAGGLAHTALVDRDVDDNGAGAHGAHHLTADQFGSDAAGDQHAADEEVRPLQLLGQGRGVDDAGAEATAKLGLQGEQPPQVAREDSGPGPQRHQHAAGGGGHGAAAEDDGAGGGHARDPAQELAPPGPRLLQEIGPHLGGHATSHLAHGEQEGQRTVGPADRLIGDAVCAGLEEGAGEVGRRRQVEVGEEDEAGTQQRVLRRQRLLDLDQKVDGSSDLRSRVGDGGPGRFVVLVWEAGAQACAVLDQHLVASLGEGGHSRGDQAHAVLLHFGLSDRADFHVHLPGDRGLAANCTLGPPYGQCGSP